MPEPASQNPGASVAPVLRTLAHSDTRLMPPVNPPHWLAAPGVGFFVRAKGLSYRGRLFRAGSPLPEFCFVHLLPARAEVCAADRPHRAYNAGLRCTLAFK